MERIKPQMIVTDASGRRGVTVPDMPGMMSCCSPEETPVVWSGEKSFFGMLTSRLSIVGPEDAKADLKKCGAGQGTECCIFLTMGSKGPCCERHSDMRTSLIFKTMNAKREPIETYPDCQKF